MTTPAAVRSSGSIALALAIGVSASLPAQRPATRRADSTATTPADSLVYRAMQWRLIGPFRGGRGANSGGRGQARPPVVCARERQL